MRLQWFWKKWEDFGQSLEWGRCGWLGKSLSVLASNFQASKATPFSNLNRTVNKIKYYVYMYVYIYISIVNQKLFQFSLLGWARGHQSSIDMPGSPSFVPSNSHVSLASSFWWSPHDRCGKDDPGPCHCHDNVGMEDPCWRSLSLDHWLVDVSNGERKKTTICIDIYLFLYGKLSGALRKERNLTFITYPEPRNG